LKGQIILSIDVTDTLMVNVAAGDVSAMVTVVADGGEVPGCRC